MENLNTFEVMCLVYGRTLLKGGCSLTMWMNGSQVRGMMRVPRLHWALSLVVVPEY